MKYAIKDKVHITDIHRFGVVLAIYISETGTQYSVRYFDDAKPQTIYFYESELTGGSCD